MTYFQGKALQFFIGGLLFAMLFIWVGIVRLKDTLAGRGRGSYAGGVLMGAGSIAFGIFVVLFFIRLATTPPEPETIPAPPRIPLKQP